MAPALSSRTVSRSAVASSRPSRPARLPLVPKAGHTTPRDVRTASYASAMAQQQQQHENDHARGAGHSLVTLWTSQLKQLFSTPEKEEWEQFLPDDLLHHEEHKAMYHSHIAERMAIEEL